MTNRIPTRVRALLARTLSLLLVVGGTLAAVDAALEPDPLALLLAFCLYGLLALPALRASLPVPALAKKPGVRRA